MWLPKASSFSAAASSTLTSCPGAGAVVSSSGGEVIVCTTVVGSSWTVTSCVTVRTPGACPSGVPAGVPPPADEECGGDADAEEEGDRERDPHQSREGPPAASPRPGACGLRCEGASRRRGTRPQRVPERRHEGARGLVAARGILGEGPLEDRVDGPRKADAALGG